jgi:hypothetical protein
MAGPDFPKIAGAGRHGGLAMCSIGQFFIRSEGLDYVSDSAIAPADA